jgi:hypothetical protein
MFMGFRGRIREGISVSPFLRSLGIDLRDLTDEQGNRTLATFLQT